MLTDNRNRTASEIRYIFSRNNGNLGETGCVAWMFERKGEIVVDLEGKDGDELMMAALEAGAEDVEVYDDEAEVVTATEDLEAVRAGILDAGFAVKEAEITMRPANTVEITDADQARKLLKLIDALEDNDDVQAVYANYDIPDSVMELLED